VANSPSQDLNLQRGDRALHSSLQEWITEQSKCETTDQGNGKALPDLDDDTSRIRQSYFSPSVVSPEVYAEPFNYAPSGLLSVVRDFETGGGVNQERVWRIMVDVTRLVCGEATDGFGWSCV